jgi:predicted membrane chloride channel (bestrophin family)
MVLLLLQLLLLLLQWYNWPMLGIQSVQTFFSAITFALTLLLVFKTNSSYARWWEARKDVGQLVSLVQDIVRQVRWQQSAKHQPATHSSCRAQNVTALA